ncbi:MAG: META domain-containing protein [Acidimicrobiales bacterium]|nr:META domain-containing protein [Acidimicrobiales bacterium]
MTDHDPTGDDLDARLRSGVAALAAEAPDPPALPERSPQAPTPRRRSVVVAAAAAILLVTIGAIAVGLRSDDPPEPLSTIDATTTPNGTERAPDRPLVGTQWLLVDATVDGEAIPFEDDPPPSFVIGDDDEFSQYDGCNGQSGEATIDGDELRVDARMSTLVGCVGQDGHPHISTVIDQVIGSTARHEIDGDRLTLTTSHAHLVYEANDELFTPTEADVLEQGELHGVPYRATWSSDAGRYGMDLQLRTDHQQPRGGAGVGTDIDDPEINLMKVDAQGSSLLFGLVHSSAARATYQAEGGDPVDLELRELDGADPGYLGVIAEVDDGQRWTVTTYDEAGSPIDKLSWR